MPRVAAVRSSFVLRAIPVRSVRVVRATLVTLVALLTLLAPRDASAAVRVGSKAFPESWILGEALAALARSSGEEGVEHATNLGGTQIAFDALASGSVDIYPDYTGTLREVILAGRAVTTLEAMRAELATRGIGVSDPLGFDDGYALAVKEGTGARLGLTKLSDLTRAADLRAGFTHEFVGRHDGWPGLVTHYGQALDARVRVRAMQHELAYDAIANDEIDLMDIYTTDPQRERLGLRVLDDDRQFFPRYDAVLLYRLELPKRAPRAYAAMMQLVGRVDVARMTHANARVVLDGVSAADAARALVADSVGVDVPAPANAGVARQIAKNTLRHVELVAISLAGSIVFGVPLGILAARSRAIGAVAVALAALIQTIPSLALLALLIPLLGIGAKPAIAALFLYGLLPIVESTRAGLASIPPSLVESADALGLSPAAKLMRVLLPIASPHVVSGVKTSAVINVGTATLAALIGGEGLGNPIMQGIALRDRALIFQGAIPAAALAIGVHLFFLLLGRVLVPKGLRL